MTETPARAVREAWAAGRAARNAWLTIPDAHLAEMVAARGVTEAVTVDLQHGLFDQGSAVQAFRAVAAHGLAPMVRLPGIDAALAGYLLDAGAAGVIAPMVETVAEAEALVAACRYPPRGRRSHGPIRTALRPGADAFAAAEEAVVFAMIETATASSAARRSPPCPGSTVCSSGPATSAWPSASLGLGPGQDRAEPELVAAFTRVLAACRSAGKHAGMHAATAGYAARMAAEGFDLVTVWVDAAAIGTEFSPPRPRPGPARRLPPLVRPAAALSTDRAMVEFQPRPLVVVKCPSMHRSVPMPQAIAYLAFDGTCADAMRFYEQALGGKLEVMMSGADSPMAAQIPKESAHRILHARLALPDGGTLFAGDAPTLVPYEGIKGVAITLNYDTTAQAEAAFAALAAGRAGDHADAAGLLGQKLGHARRQVRNAMDHQWRDSPLVMLAGKPHRRPDPLSGPGPRLYLPR